MKINLDTIKRTLKMLGFDLDEILQSAIPVINSQIDKALDNIPLEDGESKGLVITSNANGEYIIVKTKFKPNANQYMKSVGHHKLNDLLSSILTSIQNG